MLNNLKNRKKEQGFTIIEVLIVLAIAGLILLIVFLAVPALQRNARNTQRKSEAAALASAYEEYVNNHGGSKPTTAANVYNNAKLSFYSTAQITFQSEAASLNPGLPTAPGVNSVVIIAGESCDASKTYDPTKDDGSGMFTYSTRSAAILYTVEGGTNNTTTCISAA